ncbi:hybrid sensor histidine kinase/response regulator [Lamprocystis purpurea]|uniref:hybrid sensor histidine kinase/response regulator n=1 Tax=Lamprocystis purpurea TaxID=61598 RepID=UPI00037DBE40|nr:response regulator [Lamprocystis purpurea]
MALDLSKFIGRFSGEARDHLTRLTTGLAALEAQPDDAEAINALFRSAHTIKGSARMLKLTGISTTAHHLEDLLGALRAGHYRANPTGISLLLTGVDAIAAQLDQLESVGGDPPADPALCDTLARAAAAGLAAPATADLIGSGQSPVDATPDQPSPVTPPAAAAPAQHALDSVRVPLAKLDELIRLIGEVTSVQVQLRQRVLEAQHLGRAARKPAVGDGRAPGGLADPAAAQRFAHDLRDDVQAQELLVAGLRERALVLRMLPLAMVFDPAARMVRELARAQGKEVRCEVQGGEIELDRQLIEGLGSALIHVLRNAVDHGIEDPATRRAAGKPAVGQVRISARQTGGGVVLEVSDDGRGLNRERIIAKALHKGLLDPARVATLTDDQVWELSFAPGLSTSEIITDLSGRGVGLDAVKHTVNDVLQGAVSLVSRTGEGSTFAFTLPLSLAVMRVLVFACGGQRFALAAQHVVELLRVMAHEAITLAGRPAVVLRNEFVPLIPLAGLLGLPPTPAARDRASGTVRRGDGMRLVVVIGVRQAKLGLIIDQLLDERAMVIKTLPEHMRGCPLVGGIVVTGDNALVSVLQAPSLMETARRTRGETAVQGTAGAGARPGRDEPWHILVVDDSFNTREIVKDVLEACGYRVTTAEDGLDGWQKALGGRFDAVLTDVEMPGLDGFSLTAKLRTHDRYQATPIVIITSREQEEDKRRGIQVGADAYIVKGDFDQSSLLETLHNLLG